jgi:membrane protein YdbS with pleckstrin-like domain
MYCIKCGEDNLEKAKFCRKCGEPFEAEEETRVAVRPADDVSVRAVGGDEDAERQIFSISPTLMFVKAGYVLSAVGALLLVAIFSAVAPAVSTWIAIVLGLALFLIPAFYHFKQNLVRYTLTESKLEIDSGFIARSTRNIPIRRIQDVTVSVSFIQRILGFGDLVIDNASEEGGKIVLKNINTPKHYADEILSGMRRLEG